jgi:hypothetical protein
MKLHRVLLACIGLLCFGFGCDSIMNIENLTLPWQIDSQVIVGDGNEMSREGGGEGEGDEV